MKKAIYLPLILFAVIFTSCSSDDSAPQNVVIQPTITLDIATAITRPSGSDITDLIDFGQTGSASEYLVELNLDESLRLNQPNGLGNGEVLYYSRFDFFAENPLDPGVFDQPVADNDILGVFFDLLTPNQGSADIIEDPFAPGFGISTYMGLTTIGADQNNDLDWKYDIRVVIESGGSFFGYYTIDPKIT